MRAGFLELYRFSIVVAGITSVVAPINAFALSVSAALLGGYEVLSYRDDPTKLDGGSVSVGDAFDQTSFTGPAFGLGTQIGIFQTEYFEPVVALDVTSSQLSKSAIADGISSEGSFNFLHAGLGLGGRLWFSRSFHITVTVNFSRSLSDQMKTSKKETGSGQSLGQIDFKTSAHKKTSAQLGLAFLPLGSGLMLGAEARLGSGCFECSSESSALQKRAYLTRSGALSVAWMFDGGSESQSSNELLLDKQSQLKSRINNKKKDIQRKKSNKKQMPAFEESF